MFSRLIAYSFLVSLVVVNLAIDLSLIQRVRPLLAQRPPPSSHYSWIEDDIPESFALVNARPHVVMSIEESVRFGVNEPEANPEWLWTATVGDQGDVHMGPNHRFAIVGVTHGQHCLRTIRKMLDGVDVLGRKELSHAEHCLSFLRQTTLCAADTTLEPGDAFGRNFTAERVTMDDRTCMDVEAFYGSMWKQWNEWLSFRKLSGSEQT